LLLGVFAEEFFADFLGSFAAVFNLKDAGGFEFLDVFHDEVGNVEFEAGAFEAETFHADALFAQADNQADDFAVKAGGDFGFVNDSMLYGIRAASRFGNRR
jgi:hypothetical protein